ncbi:isochorismatase family cysteine hydrolase [Lysobacter capsici]|nr:isochorismatase family cysteine hydrolase [Lysobacter capsici]WND80471.1 isochorismatase family cysteine hydrolase [Lysobacter capsici]WND85668.1 isochorismatase family cysteine hydrolase [Lysobacter capsici]
MMIRLAWTGDAGRPGPCEKQNLHMPAKPTRPALLIVDMLNLLDFDAGGILLKQAIPVADRIASLKQRFKRAGAPVIYANDNFGQWHADFRELVAVCTHESCRGSPLAKRLAPDPDDFYILKPKQSAFHSTPLAVLLEHCQARRVVVTGISTDVCVAATAIDAHMRDLQVHVPSDCVAAPTRARTARALAMLHESIGASCAASRSIRP